MTTVSTRTYTIADVLQPGVSGYGIDLFSQAEIDALEVYDRNGKPYIRCRATQKERPAKPEEVVRQLMIHGLINR